VPAPFNQGIYNGETYGSHCCGLVRLPQFAFPAFGGAAVDTASATCKDYENDQDMADIVAVFHQALKADHNFGSLSESELDSAVDKLCILHLDAKEIDALGVKK
jgi:hypothetical protein